MQRLTMQQRPKSFLSFYLSPERRSYADAACASSMNLIGGLNYMLNGHFHFGSCLVVNPRAQIIDCFI